MISQKRKMFYCPWSGKHIMHKCKDSIYGEYKDNIDFEAYKIMAQKKLNSIPEKNINLVIASYTIPVVIIIAVAVDLHKNVKVYRHNPTSGLWEVKNHTPYGSSITTYQPTLR